MQQGFELLDGASPSHQSLDLNRTGTLFFHGASLGRPARLPGLSYPREGHLSRYPLLHPSLPPNTFGRRSLRAAAGRATVETFVARPVPNHD